MERNQPEQMQFFIRPGKGKLAFLCKLCHINAVCGHTADLLLRECTRLVFYLFTRIAQRATAIAKAETIHTTEPNLEAVFMELTGKELAK